MGFLEANRSLVFVLFSTAIISSQVAAGPDDTTKHFTDQSVSMLDWGIFQITQRLNGENGMPVGYAEYSYDDDRIYLKSYETNDADFDATVLQFTCKEWIDSVRHSAMINLETGEPSVYDYTFFAHLFRHNGYVVGEPKAEVERLKLLDKKFHISFSIRKSDYTERLRCTAPLVGTGFATESFE